MPPPPRFEGLKVVGRCLPLLRCAIQGTVLLRLLLLLLVPRRVGRQRKRPALVGAAERAPDSAAVVTLGRMGQRPRPRSVPEVGRGRAGGGLSTLPMVIDGRELPLRVHLLGVRVRCMVRMMWMPAVRMGRAAAEVLRVAIGAGRPPGVVVRRRGALELDLPRHGEGE